MTTQTQHTATEWRVGPTISPVEGPHYATITDGSSRVADVYAEFSSIPEMEANAAFIVRCVNSHDALVKALEDMLRAVNDCIEDGSLDADAVKKHDSTIQARAALALAKGE